MRIFAFADLHTIHGPQLVPFSRSSPFDQSAVAKLHRAEFGVLDVFFHLNHHAGADVANTVSNIDTKGVAGRLHQLADRVADFLIVLDVVW